MWDLATIVTLNKKAQDSHNRQHNVTISCEPTERITVERRASKMPVWDGAAQRKSERITGCWVDG